jgi:hypothetical protein
VLMGASISAGVPLLALGWPSQATWAVTGVCALAAVLCPRAFASAWRERRADVAP